MVPERVALPVAGITWVLVYRTDKYKRLKAEVEKQSKKCECGSFPGKWRQRVRLPNHLLPVTV